MQLGAPTFGEQLFTVDEAAKLLRWSYDSTLRYFRGVEGIFRKPPAGPFVKLRTHILIPESVLKREWTRMTTPQVRRVSTSVPARLTPKRVKMTPTQWSEIEQRMQRGESVSVLAGEFGLTRAAIYKHQKQKADGVTTGLEKAA
jgi:hypothetical protein